MKTTPWYSTEQRLSSTDEAIYHDNTCCTEGDNILRPHRVYGTGKRTICPQCARLDSAGR